jgi:hypothetical protein
MEQCGGKEATAAQPESGEQDAGGDREQTREQYGKASEGRSAGVPDPEDSGRDDRCRAHGHEPGERGEQHPAEGDLLPQHRAERDARREPGRALLRRPAPFSGRVSEHARVGSSRCTRRLTSLAVAVSCVAAVMLFGESSTGALVAVGGTGVLVAVVGLAGRAGEAAPPDGRRGLPWLAWLAAAVAWELLTLLDDDLPTLSDLADPVLAYAPVRGAATVGWLVGSAWLIARPRHRPERS